MVPAKNTMSCSVPALIIASLLQPAETVEPPPSEPMAAEATASEPAPQDEAPSALAPPQSQPAPAPVAAPAPTPAPAAQPLPEPEPPYNRRGFVLRAAAGISNCLGDFCDDDDLRVKIGPAATFELGYRPIEHISFGAGVSLARSKIDVDTGSEGPEVDASAVMLSPLAFFFVHPVKNHRLDPYGGVGVGWQLYRSKFEVDSVSDFEGGSGRDETTFTLKRGTARITGGLDIYVAERVAIGPRFDLFLGFGGEACQDDGDDEECDDVDDVFDNDEEEELPRHWIFGLNLSATF